MWKWIADLFQCDHVTKNGFLISRDDTNSLNEAVIHLYTNGLCIVEDRTSHSKWQAHAILGSSGTEYSVDRHCYPKFVIAE